MKRIPIYILLTATGFFLFGYYAAPRTTAIQPVVSETQPVESTQPIITTTLTVAKQEKIETKYTVENCRKLLDALWLQESGGRLNPPDGDNGKAIGPYQIWKVYYEDACEYDTSIAKNAYHLCRNKDFAEKVIVAYWNRFAPHKRSSAEWETLARIHNGGPTGHLKKATEKYWQSVKKFLEMNN